MYFLFFLMGRAHHLGLSQTLSLPEETAWKLWDDSYHTEFVSLQLEFFKSFLSLKRSGLLLNTSKYTFLLPNQIK